MPRDEGLDLASQGRTRTFAQIWVGKVETFRHIRSLPVNLADPGFELRGTIRVWVVLNMWVYSASTVYYCRFELSVFSVMIRIFVG